MDPLHSDPTWSNQAFKLFDDDEAGQITFTNLRRVAKELGENLTDEELQVSFLYLVVKGYPMIWHWIEFKGDDRRGRQRWWWRSQPGWVPQDNEENQPLLNMFKLSTPNSESENFLRMSQKLHISRLYVKWRWKKYLWFISDLVLGP